MGRIGNQFKDVRIFKNQIFNLMRNFMAGIKLKVQGLGVDGILRIPSIDARDARTPRRKFSDNSRSFQTIQPNLSKAENFARIQLVGMHRVFR